VLTGEVIDLKNEIAHVNLLATFGILGVTTGALQVAPSQANEDRAVPSKGPLALDRKEHGMEVEGRAVTLGARLGQLLVCFHGVSYQSMM
jgi:hypothetical protein